MPISNVRRPAVSDFLPGAGYTWAMSTPTHILLIEDDPAIAHSLRDGLTRNGYAVTWEAAARRACAAHTPARPT